MLKTAHTGDLGFSDITLITCNRPQWEHLHHEYWQTLQTRAFFFFFFPGKLVVHLFQAHH